MEVNKYIRKDGLYNGVINIISNPLFLRCCYNEIKSKPGNIKGTKRDTFFGINIARFNDICKDLKAGKYNFQPRRVMIPKPGKKELRPLVPFDKIIQKALTVVLEAI